VSALIKYTKLSNSRYKFCVTYKANSSGFDATSTAINLASGQASDTSTDNFTDTSELFIDPAHHKGVNCQTIKPVGLVDSKNPSFCAYAQMSPCPPDSSTSSQIPSQQATTSGNQASACGVNNFKTHYSGIVKSVATTDGSPIVPTADQSLTIIIQPNGSTPQGLQTITIPPPGDASISSIFNVANSRCTSIEASSLKAGDEVSVFLNNTEPNMPNAMIDFSQVY
jgi:hypothetical protein